MRRFLTLSLTLGLLLAACGGAQATDAPVEALAGKQPTATSPASEDPAEPTSTTESSPEPSQAEAWTSLLPALPADPQAVEITTSDSRTLVGEYYPAKVNPAPILVLMHWAGGDRLDWQVIAPWLQNRPDERLPGGFEEAVPTWMQRTWFPALLPEASFGVLIFDYSCFGESECTNSGDAWLQDSLAAVMFASTLEGANPLHILTMGASIGADGAVDGCYLFNEAVASGEAAGRCVGALSLSPGDFLTTEFTYAEASQALNGEDNFVYCLAAEGDTFAWAACETLQALEPFGELDFTFQYAGDFHGMFLVDPELTSIDPDNGQNALQILLEFLEAATQLPVAAD
jgi:hypothetical protein